MAWNASLGCGAEVGEDFFSGLRGFQRSILDTAGETVGSEGRDETGVGVP